MTKRPPKLVSQIMDRRGPFTADDISWWNRASLLALLNQLSHQGRITRLHTGTSGRSGTPAEYKVP